MLAHTTYQGFLCPRGQLLDVGRTAQPTKNQWNQRISGMSSVWLPLSFSERQRQSTRLQRSDKALVAVPSDTCRAFVLDLMRKGAKGRWPPMTNRGQNNAEPVQTKGASRGRLVIWMLQNGTYLSNQILITHSAAHLATRQLCWRRRSREEDRAHCQAVKPRAGHFMWVNEVDLYMVPCLKVRIPIFQSREMRRQEVRTVTCPGAHSGKESGYRSGCVWLRCLHYFQHTTLASEPWFIYLWNHRKRNTHPASGEINDRPVFFNNNFVEI